MVCAGYSGPPTKMAQASVASTSVETTIVREFVFCFMITNCKYEFEIHLAEQL